MGKLLAKILDFGFELDVFTAELVNGEFEFCVLSAEFKDFIIDFGKVIQEFLVVAGKHVY